MEWQVMCQDVFPAACGMWRESRKATEVCQRQAHRINSGFTFMRKDTVKAVTKASTIITGMWA
jgi:hypothetical protein